MTSPRPDFASVLDEFVSTSREHRLVVFAGAGLSVPRPSALPSWKELNSAFLDALCMRLSTFTEGERGGPQLHAWLVERRDEHDVIAPDFQAQLAEDECGESYFRVFAPLDVDAWNDGHAALAALASAGVLRAVVTTNFDRLTEHALRAANVEPRVFDGRDGFEELSRSLEAGRGADEPPIVIKAHGCVSEPRSMVDTLRQRVTGRPVALERAIASLLSRHATLVVGFSGADLTGRPHYLGLAEGTAKCPLFVVLNRRGDEPRKAMLELCARAERARVVDGESPEDLVRLAREFTSDSLVEPKWDAEMEYPGARVQGLAARMYFDWADQLDGISAANILATLVEAAGANTHALEILHQTWKHVRNPQQRDEDPAFLRYLTLFGRQLIEHARLGPNAQPFNAPAEVKGTPAHELLFFAAANRTRVDAWAEACRALYYVGAVANAIRCLELVPHLASEARAPVAIEAYVAASQVHIAAGDANVALEWLTRAHALVDELGDEFMRARVCAQLVRCLSMLERYDEAEQRVNEGQAAADRIHHVQLLLDVFAARGRLELERGRFGEALEPLARACHGYEKTNRVTRYAETLVAMLFAARLAKNSEWVERARTDLEPLIPLLPVIEIDLRIWYAAAYFDAEQFAQARQAIDYVRALASRMQHAKALARVDKLETLLPKL